MKQLYLSNGVQFLWLRGELNEMWLRGELDEMTIECIPENDIKLSILMSSIIEYNFKLLKMKRN